MDLSLLPSGVSQYKQRSRVHFTVRAASSPSYSLNRRTGLRKRATADETGERGRHGSSTVINPRNTEDTVSTVSDRNVKDQCEERETSSNKMTVRLTQNKTADQTVPESGSDQSENLPLGIRGRTEWKRSNFVNRSKSVDWRIREKCSDCSTDADIPALSPKRDKIKYRRASSVMETMSPTFSKCGSNSLPSRRRSLTGPDNKNTGRHPSLGLISGQSITERIEKLFSSAGLDKVGEDNSVSDASVDSRQKYGKIAGGTFPRRFSAEDFNSPVRSWMPTIWTQKENDTSSKTLPSPQKSSSQERPLGSHCQAQTWTRHTDGGGVTWRKGFVDSGTRSLDRARSKNTIAAQIRAARAAAGISSTQQPNDFSGEESASFRDPSHRLRERRASGSKLESCREEKRDSYRTNGALKERIGRVIEEHKGTDENVTEKNEIKSSALDEVFENSQKMTLKALERKKLSDILSASVKNKIDQFEALTQNAQGSEANQVSMPRRTYSVPAQLSRLYDGVKKSTSAKDIGELRNRSEGLREGWDVGGKSMRTATKFATGRSLSVDEVGLKLMDKDSGECDAAKEAESSVFDHYSKLKNTLQIPLNEGAQRKRRQLFIDETDFLKVSSPEEESKTNGTARDTSSSQAPSDVSAGEKKRLSSGPTSPLSDYDKTPTNTPDHSPFMPQSAQQDATPTAENKSTFVFTQETNVSDPSDAPPLPGPFTTSSPIDLPEFISPEVRKSESKGRKQLLDLDAWITGLNPEFKGWNYDEEDSEFDDESTEKDDDSNYDSDSGESSVTITSSHSDRKSFSVNLADLCNFTGTEYESDNDSDDWQSTSRRSASLSSDVSALSYVSLMPAEELDQLLENVRSLGNNTLQDYNDVQVVVLHKDVGVGLGFSLAGGVDQSKPITVHKVFHSGVAAKEGSIREGDRVLSINGTALQGTAHWEALRVLRRAKTRDMGVVVLKRDDATGPPKRGVQGKSQSPPSTQCDSGQRVCLQLQKNSRDLGFSLEGGVDSSEGNRPLTVQKVFLGGPVDKVQSGDEILEIQGKSVVGMRRLEAWTLIRTLPSGPVDVVLCRHPETSGL